MKKTLLGWQHVLLQNLYVPFSINGAFTDVQVPHATGTNTAPYHHRCWLLNFASISSNQYGQKCVKNKPNLQELRCLKACVWPTVTSRAHWAPVKSPPTLQWHRSNSFTTHNGGGVGGGGGWSWMTDIDGAKVTMETGEMANRLKPELNRGT